MIQRESGSGWPNLDAEKQRERAQKISSSTMKSPHSAGNNTKCLSQDLWSDVERYMGYRVSNRALARRRLSWAVDSPRLSARAEVPKLPWLSVAAEVTCRGSCSAFPGDVGSDI